MTNGGGKTHGKGTNQSKDEKKQEAKSEKK